MKNDEKPIMGFTGKNQVKPAAEGVGGRTNIQQQLSQALKTGSNEPISFGRLSPEKFQELNRRLIASGERPLSNPNVYIHPRVVQKLMEKRISVDKMTPDQVADIAYSAIHGDSKIISTREPQIKAFIKPKDNIANTAYIGEFGGSGSIKSVYPKELKKILVESQGGRGVPPSGASRLNPADPIPAVQDSTKQSIALDVKDLEDFLNGKMNDVMKPTVMSKTGGVGAKKQ